ncbi:heme oxygenase (biliverdin-producing) [Ideonella sp. A 288]|uniref:biliverdin-producing heme oxygenase n=1 Tax=Ideonella sp. A 288 TaxID=1962181 RepID=UPI000B4C0CF4|nr:biliverdin-producing heme oxygenase [Ideonella sp. A 288]
MSIALSQRLRDATRTLHTEVERSGLMRRLLRGEIERRTYCQLLRNLHAIYTSLEDGLARHVDHPRLAELPLAPLARRDALQADLVSLHGADWADELPLVPAAQAYADHLRALADERPQALAAHAYVRYLGDLNGGQVLMRIVAKGLQLPPGDGVSFYDFGPAAAVTELVQGFRAGLEQQADDEAAAQALVQEACDGFARHKDLFEQIAAP